MREVLDPLKLLRIASMLGSGLDEARDINCDERTAARLALVAGHAVKEACGALSEHAAAELAELLGSNNGELTARESRVVTSQLAGWMFGALAMDEEGDGLLSPLDDTEG